MSARLRTPRGRLAAVFVTAAALSAVLVGASQVGARGAAPPAAAAETQPTSPARSLFAGIEQHGAALGSPRAPVTIVEYADLQCPYCALWARDALPAVVDRYVRTGKVRIVFRGLAFIGPDSDKALRTAIAAGAQGHFWDVVDGLYESQGTENAGWVTDELVTAIAASVRGLDGPALLADRWDAWVGREVKRAAAAANAAGVDGTPLFQVGPTGGQLELVRLTSLRPDGFTPAIDAMLSR